MKKNGFRSAKQNLQTPNTDQSSIFVGVDGGGTKTLAVVLDESGDVLSEGVTGASNPLRVGIETAVTNVAGAIDKACDVIGKLRSDVVAVQIGLAGVRREDVRARMRESLVEELNVEKLEVVTDAEIALYGATNGAAGLVIIAGTGSICCGRNARGEIAMAGGWGPIAGDEGSGSGIARRALQSIAKASDGRAEKTSLSQYALDYFRAASVEDLATVIYAPMMTNDRIAGFTKLVIKAAREKDFVAIDLLNEGAGELGLAANAVIGRLKLEKQKFQVAYVGGVFNAQHLIFDRLIETIRREAPQAFLAAPQLAPAEAAGKMALSLAGEINNKNQELSASSTTQKREKSAPVLSKSDKASSKRLRL